MNELEELKQRIAELERENQRLAVWRDEVIDVCIINFLDMDWDANPRQTLAKLIEWEVKIALDPAVSSAAQELINQGYALACRDSESAPLGEK
jgi:hypothetical protein